MTDEAIKNQYILKEFVEQNVICCISDFADYLFDWDDDSKPYRLFDEFSNMYNYFCPHCDTVVENTIGHEVLCPFCGQLIKERDLDMRPKEIFEYYIVTPFLGEQLKKHDGCVLERWGGWIWGRDEGGQPIFIDGIIEEIAKDLKILTGQEHEWKLE